MSAAWLLPVVTLIVAASTGGVLGLALQNYSPRHALITVTFSVFLVAVGLCLAFMILTLYLGRLIIHGLPPGVRVLSVFLPLGPTGQSGFAWYLIGRNLHTLLPYVHAGDSGFLSSPATADILTVLCTSSAFLMWCLATMWMLYALLALQSTVLKSPVAFKMSFWGLVFPNVRYLILLPPFVTLSKLRSEGCLRQLNNFVGERLRFKRPPDLWRCVRCDRHMPLGIHSCPIPLRPEGTPRPQYPHMRRCESRPTDYHALEPSKC